MTGAEQRPLVEAQLNVYVNVQAAMTAQQVKEPQRLDPADVVRLYSKSHQLRRSRQDALWNADVLQGQNHP